MVLKQCKTLSKDHMVRLKIITLYIYIKSNDSRDLSHKQPSAQSSVWFLFQSCFENLRPEIKHFRILKRCYWSHDVALTGQTKPKSALYFDNVFINKNELDANILNDKIKLIAMFHIRWIVWVLFPVLMKN